MESSHIFLWKQQRGTASWKRKRLKHQRTPHPSSFCARMLFMLLTDLPKLILWGLFGAHFGIVESPFSLYWSGDCIIYECCGCYYDPFIGIVDTSSWNKNNEATINLSAVNSHLREQHVRFISPRSQWHQILLCVWYAFILDRSNGLASRPISHWISFHFKPSPNPPSLFYQRHELRLSPHKVFFIFCHGFKQNGVKVFYLSINYVVLGHKRL